VTVRFVRGDIFLSQAQTLAHGCNARGRMGAGIALEIRNRFPTMFEEYRRRCHRGELQPGTVYLEKGTSPWILNLITQDTTAGAQLDHVERCVRWIAVDWEIEGITSVAMPRIGSGLGGLPWEAVLPLIEELLGPLSLPVWVYDEYLPGVAADEAVLSPEGIDYAPVLFGRGCEPTFASFSNFALTPIEIDGREYPTVEHYYQASKALIDAEHEIIRSARTPKEAKKLGRKVVQLRPEWDRVRIDVMRQALVTKFRQHPALGDLLLSTGNRPIHELSPHDAVWAWWDGSGGDLLGKLLAELRGFLRPSCGDDSR
jgi:ribA/ribD-fused uncharacterized protein